MPLKIGTSAPDFTLKTQTAQGLEDVKLSDNFGKRNTVLLFFPLAFTGVCTQEFCNVTGGISAYEGLNAAVYGISIDSPFAQEAWATKEKITVKLLSDLKTRPSSRPTTWCSRCWPASAMPPRAPRSSSINRDKDRPTRNRRPHRPICLISTRSRTRWRN